MPAVDTGGQRAAWAALRETVLNRDGHRCRRCGQPTDVVHHIWGSTDHIDNLVAACPACVAQQQDAEAEYRARAREATEKRRARLEESSGWVYRLYGRTRRLLYIGTTTRDPIRRLREHRDDKPWFVKVRRAGIEEYTNGLLAYHAEQAAILDEHPQYNDSSVKPMPGPPEGGGWVRSEPIHAWTLVATKSGLAFPARTADETGEPTVLHLPDGGTITIEPDCSPLIVVPWASRAT